MRALQLLARLPQRKVGLPVRPLLDELLPRTSKLLEVRHATGRPIEPGLKKISPGVVTEQLAVVGLDLARDRQTSPLIEGLLSQADGGGLLRLGSRRRLSQRLQARLRGGQKIRDLLASCHSPITLPLPIRKRFLLGVQVALHLAEALLKVGARGLGGRVRRRLTDRRCKFSLDRLQRLGSLLAFRFVFGRLGHPLLRDFQLLDRLRVHSHRRCFGVVSKIRRVLNLLELKLELGR